MRCGSEATGPVLYRQFTSLRAAVGIDESARRSWRQSRRTESHSFALGHNARGLQQLGFSRPGPPHQRHSRGIARNCSDPALSPRCRRAKPPAPERREAPQSSEAPSLAPLSLGAISTTQNICAGSRPSGWIKINDVWNPTVCGKPATIIYNVWIIQQLSDQPVGAVTYVAVKEQSRPGWAVVGAAWNPTVCGHLRHQPVQRHTAIKRLN